METRPVRQRAGDDLVERPRQAQCRGTPLTFGECTKGKNSGAPLQSGPSLTDVYDVNTLTLRSPNSSPFATLNAITSAQPTPQKKRSLLTMSRLAEAQTLSAPQGALICAVLQEAKHYTERTSQRYQLLATRGVHVLLFAHGWNGVSQPQPGLRLVGLAEDDAVRNEWDVLVCSPRRRFGFVSQDTKRPVDHEMDRTFAWLTSHDEASIGRAAEALLQRVPTLPITVPQLAT